ncbi:glycerophosphodiester phosphodiesterase [Horticoccus luteus]|uniref:Glycerophosphodiester phosphodiesterase n=1 Tax=Horticoccus luteus TaxID=2862869 RepID=A0A8F9XKF8_9BACT|nr:glycerophosphodiester phosphodiesterase family protein [Horticoccus luteus]QYM78024.1 glycerophosphodiester phosphodiesterase [Horticoccus luteus]
MEIIAHRGASHDAPENTVAAARLAWAQGADALECDVRTTADGRLVALHDADLRRVGGAATGIADLTWAAVRDVDVGRWKAESFRGERVPALEELLAVTPAGKRVLIEIKDGVASVEPVARVVEATAGPHARVAVIAFDLAVAVAAKGRLPAADVLWIIDSPRLEVRTWETLVTTAQAAGVDGLDVHCAWPNPAAAVRRAREAGLRTYVWTVDTPGTARRWRDAGADGLTTNRPGWLRSKLQECDVRPS